MQVTFDNWATPAEDIVLASTPDIPPAFTPYLGDYADLQAMGSDFYGAFCAQNIPDLANFPHGVRFQRNADFTAHQLLDLSGVTPVASSVDPFFFHISWHEEEREERPRFEPVRRLIIRGLRYERIEVEELELGV